MPRKKPEPKGFRLSEHILSHSTTAPVEPKLDLTHIFDEEPVDLNTFVTSARYLNNPAGLSEKQYDLVRHMEQIYMPSLYPLMVEAYGDYWTPVRQVNYLFAQWGKGAGKDHAVRIAVARIAYLLLCLKSPQEHYGLAAQDDIHILNVAMNSDQAKRAFFKPLGTLLRNSQWFKDKLKALPTDQSRSIRLIKQVELISGHSEVEGYEGLNLIAGVCDEISGFESDDQKARKGVVESTRTAEAIFTIIKTSAATRFPESFKVVAISYPRFLNDPIQSLTSEAKKDIEEKGEENSFYWVSGPFATWEVNPRYDRYERITVPGSPVPIPNLKFYVDEFAGKKSAEARGKYLCMPERSANRFFRNDSSIYASFPVIENFVEPVEIEYYWGIDTEGEKSEDSADFPTVAGWQVNHLISPDLKPMDGAIYALHADQAIRNDRAGIAMCHVKNWERRGHEIPGSASVNTSLEPDMQEDDRPVIKVDFVTYYEADLAALNPDNELKPREIQIRWFRSLVRELKRRGFVIGLVSYDNFASEDSIQILESWGIPAAKQSMDRQKLPYSTMRDVMYDGRLLGYYNKILVEEIQGLTDLPNKIDHAPGASKDLSDALCGAILGALSLGGDEGATPLTVDESTSTFAYFENEYVDRIDDGFWSSMNLGGWANEEEREAFAWNI